MKTLIVPDIHNKVKRAQSIVDREPEVNLRVFLGDIYDDWGDDPEAIGRTARWHKRMLEDPKNVFLMGNHDMAYRFPQNRYLQCSGWTPTKSRVVNEIMGVEDWEKCRLCFMHDGFYISHAGIHRLYTNGNLILNCIDALEDAKKARFNPLVGAGRARGGNQAIGGLTWLDWNEEFEPVGAFKQIVGHTPGKVPREREGNWCLDTHLEHYGVLTDRVLEIKEF